MLRAHHSWIFLASSETVKKILVQIINSSCLTFAWLGVLLGMVYVNVILLNTSVAYIKQIMIMQDAVVLGLLLQVAVRDIKIRFWPAKQGPVRQDWKILFRLIVVREKYCSDMMWTVISWGGWPVSHQPAEHCPRRVKIIGLPVWSKS